MSLNPPLRDWSGRRVWLIGASTGIGEALAHALHGRGAQVLVSARSDMALADFVARHPGSQAQVMDVTDGASVQRAAQAVLADAQPLDLVVYCAGHYRPMRATAIDLDEALQHQRVNMDGVWLVLAAVLPTLLRQGHGHISLMASVAGYRALPQALAYGHTKAAMQHLAENLYLDLQPEGLAVSVLNPGFVETRLTAQNRFEMPAMIQPAEAAEAILHGWARGQYEIHFPKRFTRLMKLMHCLPQRLYFALMRRITPSH